jgi:hypothetical protein
MVHVGMIEDVQLQSRSHHCIIRFSFCKFDEKVKCACHLSQSESTKKTGFKV